MTPMPYGFRVLGHPAGTRRPIDFAAAFTGHAECDPRAEPDREAYLSLFSFGPDFREYLERNRSEASYGGPCGAPWLWWDVDRENDLPAALSDTRRLAATTLERFPELDEDDVLIFLSGGKGFHVGIPATWQPEPSPSFHTVAKSFCLELAGTAGVTVDGLIYTKTRLFRAPNSRHSKTGLFKRRLTFGELIHDSLGAIEAKAAEPEPFEIPDGPSPFPSAADAWRRAIAASERRAERRPKLGDTTTRLSAFARRFIRDGELDGDKREVSTFRVAAELTEVYLNGGIDRLVSALIEESALDSGLSPSEVKHAIDGGLAHAKRQQEGGAL